ncbi:hypothetical protein PFICI_04580 [Pestalotiopsis fici W106-1]|uniref:Uncharacterized protein n=1 Tax=Pestalotiopsis fici (strain W106-1 / CGMCC3.15140) TaxID=1229662 RepID=W3X9J2_PESFW|nr:uncharacterized protein PFICI_04580 [Pestalotiopsis fici W106-1]ETS82704.1 hypothetical protein PFICI_04580 [Pestalotiopsis fici W106-1]
MLNQVNLYLAPLCGFWVLTAGQLASSKSSQVHWLGELPEYNPGTTFGLPWARGQFDSNSTTFIAFDGLDEISLQSWVTGFWPDGSIKWTGHAVGASDKVFEQLTITASGFEPNQSSNYTGLPKRQSSSALRVDDSADNITVETGKISVSFPKTGNSLVSSILTSSGKLIGTNGRLVLQSQSGVVDDGTSPSSIDYLDFESQIESVTLSLGSFVRALVTVNGTHTVTGDTEMDHRAWLPFTVRFYLYADSPMIRIIHSIVYDGDSSTDIISSLGIRFDVPLKGEQLFDRHIRIGGLNDGFLHESAQGITSASKDPGLAVRTAQYEGKAAPPLSQWNNATSSRLQWIPTWNDFRLLQLSPDGFTVKKRTKSGQSWVKIPGGSRSNGFAFLGGPTVGGLGLSHRDFWKRYPTGLDVNNATADMGSITLWLYSPEAPPNDMRPYHDTMGADTYAKQLDMLEATYEDYEPGYNTPYGIARTNEVFLVGFDETPPSDFLATLARYSNEPPVLVADPNVYIESRAIGSYWDQPDTSTADSQAIESKLEFLVQFYREQVEQRRWYGFWDHGDIMHRYDDSRHTWRYDSGGYAWDNSELSPDLFFWNQFLRTGNADVYRLAEAQVRHGGEVDVYHLGNFSGLGTRHGVQHWGDSAKQARISTPIYRRVFYYVSGGDERTGDLIHETLQAEWGFVNVDARRKVRDPSVIYVPSPEALYIAFGTDWAGLACAQLMEWERRGPRWIEARDKLTRATSTIPKLKFGFVTGEATYNLYTGEFSAPPTDPDNLGTVDISHLNGVFGMQEVIDQIIEHFGSDLAPGFEDAWLDYGYYYGAPKAEQQARFGKSFSGVSLRQGHSKHTAYAANRRNNSTLAARAWKEFLDTDGLKSNGTWATTQVNGSLTLIPVTEATFVTTNDAALFGLAAIELFALVGSPNSTTV